MLLIPWTYNTWSEYEHLYSVSANTQYMQPVFYEMIIIRAGIC